jgi:hypothetical protein
MPIRLCYNQNIAIVHDFKSMRSRRHFTTDYSYRIGKTYLIFNLFIYIKFTKLSLLQIIIMIVKAILLDVYVSVYVQINLQ